MIASIELQKAVYKALSVGEYEIHDVIPQSTSYPYILIGNIVRTPYNTKTTGGYSLQVALHIYTKSDSSLEAKEIGNFVENALLSDIEIDGFHNMKSDFNLETYQIEKYDNETIHHYIQEYTFLLNTKEI